MGPLREETLSKDNFFLSFFQLNLNLRILLNLIGIEEIDDIAQESVTLMKEIDDDRNGHIDQEEWRAKWVTMQKALGKTEI